MNEVLVPLPPAYNLSEGTLLLDANVVINYLNSDPTGGTLNLLLSSSANQIVISSTVDEEIQNNVSGTKYAVYSAWAYNNYYGTGGKVRPWPTDRPAGNGGGELSIVDIINEDFVGGPYIVGSGDSGDDNPDLDYLSQLPANVPVLSSVGVANAMLISGDISFARYEALIAQIGVVAPSELVSGDNPMVYLPGMKVIIDGVEVEFRTNLGVIVNGEPLGPGGRFSIHPQNGLEIIENNSCFGSEVPIDMWPLDPTLKPGPDGIYDQESVRAKIWKKPIELIRVGDIVVSFDENDNLVPGPVTRTMTNSAKILLNFHGTRVTPGHVYYRPDSKKAYKYETLIDILRDDGMIKHQDGRLIRAASNVPVDSPRDGFIKAIAGKRNSDGTFEQTDEGRIRLGTRFLVGTGKERKSFAVADLIEAGGGVVGEDELIRVDGGEPMPFLWDFGEALPKPEDFVLACSGTTLEDIYKAAEWESQGPRLPAPMVLDRGPVQPLKGAALSAMPRNEPLNVAHAPIAPAKPQRTLNRKQRKAMEAKQRKAAKPGKRVAG